MMTNADISLQFEDSPHKSSIGHISNAKSAKGNLFWFAVVQKMLHYLEPKEEKLGHLRGLSLWLVWVAPQCFQSKGKMIDHRPAFIQVDIQKYTTFMVEENHNPNILFGDLPKKSLIAHIPRAADRSKCKSRMFPQKSLLHR